VSDRRGGPSPRLQVIAAPRRAEPPPNRRAAAPPPPGRPETDVDARAAPGRVGPYLADIYFTFFDPEPLI